VYGGWIQMEVDTTPMLDGYTVIGRADSSEVIHLMFAVKQNNLYALEKVLLDVSNPDSSNYGKHLSNQEVHQLIAPRPENIQAVLEYLESFGIIGSAATPNSDFIEAMVTVKDAEALLNAEYFELRKGSHSIVRTFKYHLPEMVSAVVDFVAPTVRIPSFSAAYADPPENGLFNTPSSLKKLYGVNEVVGKSDVKQAVTAFLEQVYSPADLQEFYRLFCREVTCGSPVEVALKGDFNNTGLAGTEMMLDIEYITALGANITTEIWSFAGRSPDNANNEPFLKWLVAVSNTSDSEVPKLFSTSYGEPENTVSLDWAQRLNVEFQKAGARGISLLFASGDSGADCVDGIFTPQWPSGSPWITAVGGTTGTPERGAGLSSGGFSNRWDRPSYQSDAVAKYLAQVGLPDSSKFNQSGRGFPDISAQATNFVVVANKIPNPGVAGTSCASPTAAGVFGLLNDLRIQNGKSTLGFLNPFIYKHFAAFNDISSGSNNGCLFSDGFPATEGWDAVTGAGTPNYENLATIVSALP